jgi:type VI secretion system secreted protein VgrG
MLGSAHSFDGNGEGSPVTQTGHLLAIETELGKDALLLTALDGAETVSRGFVYTIDMLTLASDDKVRSLLGKAVTIWLYNDVETVRRPLHGHIRHLTRLTVDIRGYRRWMAEVVPFMWFLTRSVDCQIFQDLTIPEIVRTVFDEHELTNYEFRLHDQYPKHVFCVQYRESAHSFVSRLMEHAGIFYWFEHHKDRHVLVLTDNNRAAKFTEPQQAVLSLRPDLGQIQDLVHDFTFRTGNWALNDFDFEVPTKNLRTHEPTVLDVPPMKRFETFDYPGSYAVPEEGKKLTRLRIQEEEARHYKVSGSGSCVGFHAGKRFTLMSDLPVNGGKPSSYLLTEVRHTARDSSYFSTEAEPATYSNRFVCIPVDMQFRPERLTPKPIVQGPQTATVVGPAGENIHTDQYGRVRLLFHWDRRGKRDEHASCWIRVSQNSAGSHWGGLANPHVGQEVIVAFLEGDPDRPIVTGHVHNGNNMPPLNLPRDRHKTIIRDHGDNKLIMHGKAGYQWLSAVSPHAVNLVAMRSAAKPLSADVNIDGVGFDPSQDDAGFGALSTLWGELQGKTVQTTDAASLDPKASYSVDKSGDDDAYQASVNLLTEGEINSLSVSNTNTWVGHDMNTWVKNNAHNHICNWQFDYYLYHQELNPLLHLEETPGLHFEVTGIHIEDTILHIEGHTGIHIQVEAGGRYHIGDMVDLHQDQQNLEFFNSHIKVVNDNIETINSKISTINEAIETIENRITVAQLWSINTDVIMFQAAKSFEVSSAEIQLRASTATWIGGSLNLTGANILLG